MGTRLIYEGKKENVKEYQHDIVYYVKCPESQCSDDYTGETARRLSKRVLEHNGRYAKSHPVKHTIEKSSKYPKIEDFDITDKSYRNSTYKGKVTKYLSIYIRPTLNTHEKSVPLKLFN